jgi:cytochrome c biogenesis protein CcmG/thiol:disulfide interchange protein DsbE
MKNYRLLTRSTIAGMSLVLVSTLLPLDVFAKKSSSDTPSKTKSSKSKHSKKSKSEETNTSTTTTTSSTTSGIADQKSDEVLHQVSDFYSGLKSWKTRLIQKLVASSDLKSVELLSVVDVSVKQPDLIALNLRAGMPGGSMYSDGKDAYFYSQILNKYNVKPAPSDLEKLFGDASSRYVNGPYAMYSLLPSVAGKDAYGSIMAGVKKVEYAGAEDIDGTQCHHLRFTQANFNWDLWVDAGKDPWIVKVSPDLFPDLANAAPKTLGRVIPKNTKMSLTFRYKNWVANPSLKKSAFIFDPPPESTETKSFAPDTAEEKPEKVEKSPMVGKDAPTFKLSLTDGKEFDLSKHKNKDIVVIDFWASWCPPCRQSLPILLKVTKEFKNDHVVFYPINVGESQEAVKEYIVKANLDMTAALDTDKKVSDLYGVTGIPQTVIIDKNGVVQVLTIGFGPNMEKRVTSELDALVKGKSLE